MSAITVLTCRRCRYEIRATSTARSGDDRSVMREHFREAHPMLVASLDAWVTRSRRLGPLGPRVDR